MKKGLSAIVSTILLIVFVISLGVMIMSWSRGLLSKSIKTSETKIGSELECSDVKIKLDCDKKSVCDDRKTGVCGDINKPYIIIKNNGNKDLVGYVVREISPDDGVKVIEKNDELSKIEAYGAKTCQYTKCIKKIEIIPRISIEGGEIVDCTGETAAYTF